MSFNIRWDNPEDGENGWPERRSACAELLDEHAPDVVGFQETQHHMVIQLQEDMPEYDWVGVGRDDGLQAGEYAPIFYRRDLLDLVDWDTFWLSETPEEVSLGWDAAAIRIVTWAEFERADDGGRLFVFNTHFDHEGREARRESALLLAEKIEDIAGLDVPVFVTGDFNAGIATPMFDPLLEILADARDAPETDSHGTFNGFGSPLAPFVGSIDFVLYREAAVDRFETVTANYGVRWVSDHYPVVAEFRH